MMTTARLLALAAALAGTPAFADTLSVEIPTPKSPGLPKHMGTNTSPAGDSWAWDAMSLLKNGKPVCPVMGEIHFTRYPNAEWREELLKMKAGGITLISTYVFWIHHEEERGKFTWDGDKNLRQFIQTCQEVGLPVIVRVGPWCHGEVRNGGFPDWVQAMRNTRTNDPAYLAAVTPYYTQVASQLKGLYFKDGGPIIGLQFENEFKGPAAHLVTLKKIATDAGIDVPLYTRTAWDNATNFPTFGEVLPLWGGYAEGFWDRSLDSMPGNYWQTFQFAVDRAPSNAMGADPNAVAAATQRGDVLAYPYLTCELGGGMMSSYHRRIDIAPMDVYAVALAKVGSGSNMPGYYMYHGGTNPEGKLSYLMESQSPPQNMWNDMPVKNYDFGAILGACGEVRDSYHLTRMLHLFLSDWGQDLARMPATIVGTARNKQDTATVRWSVRSDGKSGFLFVNNYQRAQDMPAKPNTQFAVRLAGGIISLPEQGALTIPANSSFVWPLNLDLGGVTLRSATAQPVCRLTDGNTTYTVFAQTGDVPFNFEFAPGATVEEAPVPLVHTPNGDALRGLQASRTPITLHTADGRRQVIYLATPAEALSVWKGEIAGTSHLFFGTPDLTFDGPSLHLRGPAGEAMVLNVLPPLDQVKVSGDVPLTQRVIAREQRLALAPENAPAYKCTLEPIKPAGALRTITLGSQKVAAEPTDADFANAAVWRIKLPADIKGRRVILRLPYTGDVARVYLGDRLILDDFYNGKPLDLALWRYGDDILTKDLTVRILPLQKGAPFFMARWPAIAGDSVCTLDTPQLIEERAVTLTAK